jgi:ABC-type transport system involved in multi-copper enzyme maturation permease subunit
MTTLPNATILKKPTWTDDIRLVWALAAKDIVDALKSKATLTTLLLSLLMVLFYRYFPQLTSGDTLDVRVFAESESEIVEALERSPSLALYSYESEERLFEVVRNGDSAELGIVIPDEAVRKHEDGEPVTLDGYLMYWVNQERKDEIKALVEEDLTLHLGRPATLNLEGNELYFDADRFFFVFSATTALLFVSLMIGISAVPNLMVEEKMSKTIDALMVSPASATHLVAGKSLAGLFYGLVGSVVVLVTFRYLIIQWELAVLAAVLSVLLMVAIGLLLGSYAEVRSQLQMAAWIFIIPLLIPVILVALEGLVPQGAMAIMNWIPTVLIAKIFRLSLTPNATIAHYGVEVAIVVASTLALLGIVVAIVRRRERR